MFKEFIDIKKLDGVNCIIWIKWSRRRVFKILQRELL